MPDTDSILIGKTFLYRGQQEVWTNKYHLEGTTPTTQAEWLALGIAIWNSERTFYANWTSLASIIGYQAGNEAAKAMFTTGQFGAATTTGAITGSTQQLPGDSALWLRWSTPDRNSKNKPIYLRKYFHGIVGSGAADLPLATARTSMLAHGNKMIDGTLPGGMKVCGPQGADASNPQVAQYYTTRTLKRNARTPV